MFVMREYQRKRRHGSLSIREADNERTKRYQATEKGKAALRASYMNARAKLVGAEGRLTGADMLRLLSNPGCACPGCEDQGPFEIDHIQALVLGGKNVIDNLCLLCIKHHVLKSAQERRMKAHGGEHLDWVTDLMATETRQIRLCFE